MYVHPAIRVMDAKYVVDEPVSLMAEQFFKCCFTRKTLVLF